jgi:methylenetetrahydrofolate reductase (NADPH)
MSVLPDEPEPGLPLPILPGHVSAGRLERVLRAGHFAVTTELAPPDSADPEEVYARARIFDGYVDAINATDGSGANCHMSSVAVCSLLTRIGYSPVLQISCRDRNRIAIQGEILGGAAMGVCNLLCLSGDGVQAGDHPQAKPVFDLDSVTLLATAKRLRDEARFESGRKLTAPPRLFLGGAANPFAHPLDWQPWRLAQKVKAGAQFIQTQYCYDIERLKTFLARIDDIGLTGKVFLIIGVGPLASAKSAEWIRKAVPGVHIPDSVIKRLAGAEKPKAEGRKLCVEMIQQISELKGAHGVHVMAFKQEEAVAQIVSDSGVLHGRTPWSPARAAARQFEHAQGTAP